MLLGARQFFAAKKAAPPLPYDAEVEYLETEPKSTGRKQYIDTLVASQTGLRAHVRFMWLSNSVGYDNYILAQTGNTRFYFGTYQSKWMFGYNTYWQADGTRENVLYNADVAWYNGTPYVDIDGTRLISGNYTLDITNNGTMLLLSRQTNHDAFAAHARIYSCKLWQQEVLVRDFIPVRFTNEQGISEGAMYDRVSETLFRNAGTGAFSIGPDKA